MLLNEYLDLMELKAIQHPQILHNTDGKRKFAVVEIDEILSGIAGLSHGYCLVVEYPESKVNEKHSDNRLDLKTCGFAVIHAVKDTDFKKYRALIAECEKIARQILARLKFMATKRQTIKQLDLEEAVLMPVGPKQYAGFVGFRIEHTMYTSEPSNYYDAALWPPL